MRRFFLAFAMMLLLAGCEKQQDIDKNVGNTVDTTVDNTTESDEDQTPKISLIEQGIAWDEEGALLEIPLTIPKGWHFSNSMEYEGNLLLWNMDTHLDGRFQIEMCLMELEYGTVLATNEIDVSGYVAPQIFKDCIYLCDSVQGAVIKLDKELQIVEQWEVEPDSGNWIIGAQDVMYQHDETGQLVAYDLQNGNEEVILDNVSYITSLNSESEVIQLEYYHPETREAVYGTMNLTTGEVENVPFRGSFSGVSRYGKYWLTTSYREGYVIYLGTEEEQQRIIRPDNTMRFLEEGYILETDYSQYLKLYDLTGQCVSGCRISSGGDFYPSDMMIYSEEHGGYFFQLKNYESNRLLFWDLDKGKNQENLVLEPVPKSSETMILLQERAEEIGKRFGLKLWVGDEAETSFYDFTTTQVTDYETVTMALDTLEKVLESYPEGFFKQIQHEEIKGIQIHLVGTLEAAIEQWSYGSYSAFVNTNWDHYLMVVDITRSSYDIYYHEISHVIDRYLAWDAENREGALFSETAWNKLNPKSFSYAQDYRAEFEDFPTEYEDWFIDTYSTVSATEDRARVLEYGMSVYSDWVFSEKEGVRNKLEYYCKCIRDAFDTTGWPEVALWEQYLEQ